ncbi:hypothetical protein [Priestia megaterium]|uniref:hypothetical protein n=1 Tax=Priestia megaterium TaxID=1404 RepID=UPI000BF5EB8A|nr:hypothetical protein [Priestia megaterium]PFT49485.1 hypothetical protein COK68_28600 [Priestia megaterium]
MSYKKNSNDWFKYVNQLNIYQQPYTHMNGRTCYGAAGLSTRLANKTELAYFFEEHEVGKTILGFEDYYYGELERVVEEYGIFLNLDRAGVGDTTRNIFRGVASFDSEPAMQKAVSGAYHSLCTEEERKEFRKQWGYFRCSNFIIDNKIVNCPVKDVW